MAQLKKGVGLCLLVARFDVGKERAHGIDGVPLQAQADDAFVCFGDLVQVVDDVYVLVINLVEPCDVCSRQLVPAG